MPYDMVKVTMPDSAWDFIVDMLMFTHECGFEHAETRYLSLIILNYIEKEIYKVEGDDPFETDVWDNEKNCFKEGHPKRSIYE